MLGKWSHIEQITRPFTLSQNIVQNPYKYFDFLLILIQRRWTVDINFDLSIIHTMNNEMGSWSEAINFATYFQDTL